MSTPQALFSLRRFVFGAVSTPERFEWVKMNLDTGAAVDTCSLNFCPDGEGDGWFHRAASGECIPDSGAWQCQCYDENGLRRSLNGRLTGVHKVLWSAAEIAYKGRQDFCLGSDCGFVIPVHSKVGHEMRKHSERLVNGDGRKQLIPVYMEDNSSNFYLSKEVNRNQ